MKQSVVRLALFLVRNDNIASPTFDALAQDLSPRIARVGLTLGF